MQLVVVVVALTVAHMQAATEVHQLWVEVLEGEVTVLLALLVACMVEVVAELQETLAGQAAQARQA